MSDELRKLAQYMIDNGIEFEDPTPQKKAEPEPLTLKEKIIGWSIFGFIALTFILVFAVPSEGGSGGSSELSKKRQAEKIIKSQLNYPSSYSLQGWAVDGNRVILEYKAKNAFGMEKTRRDVVYVD